MNRLTKWSLTAALAGFLFGFDTVVISGADQKLQLLWNSTDIFHGSVVMAMALWGTVVGAIFGGIPTRKIGRKKRGMIILYLFFDKKRSARKPFIKTSVFSLNFQPPLIRTE